MSGSAVARALADRFASMSRAEFERLGRKLNRLNDGERRVAEAIVTEVFDALMRVPVSVLAAERDPRRIEAAVRLFNLELREP